MPRINRNKIAKGEEWLEEYFVPNILSQYFPKTNFSLSFSPQMSPGEFYIDNDTDGSGQTTVSLNVTIEPQQSEVFRQAIENDYQGVITPFEMAVSELGWDAQILGGDDDTWSFEVTVY